MKMLESVPDYRYCPQNRGRDGHQDTSGVLDWEFFSVDAASRLQENNVKFLMPCKNTCNVVAVLRESAQGKRRKSSRNVIENNRGSAVYSIW